MFQAADINFEAKDNEVFKSTSDFRNKKEKKKFKKTRNENKLLLP
jgi:hypothetical protein